MLGYAVRLRTVAAVVIGLWGAVASCSDDSSESWVGTPNADSDASSTGGEGGSGGGEGGSGGGETGGAAGAGGSTSTGGSAGTAGASTGGTSAGGFSGAAGSAGSAQTTPVCQMGCSSPVDCTTTGGFPASEWSCDNGLCRYKGCSGDAVCAQVYNSDKYVCRPSPYGGNIDMCALRCQSASDCASDQGAFSVDNYQCKGDYCAYLGCNDDSECKTTMQGLDYRCRPLEGLNYSTCQKGCSAPADCEVPNSPAYAASTWKCEQDACKYLGCPSDAACQQSLANSKYVCK